MQQENLSSHVAAIESGLAAILSPCLSLHETGGEEPWSRDCPCIRSHIFMCDLNFLEQPSHQLISDATPQRACVCCTKESESVAEEHRWAQVVNEVQIGEGPSDTVIL